MQIQEAFTLKKYIDRDAIENHIHHSTLFLYFSSKTLKVIIASKSKNAVLGLFIFEVTDDFFKKSELDIESILNTLDFDKHGFSNIKIIVENNLHTLIPEALFIAEKADSYLKLNQTLSNDSKVLFNRLPKNMVNIFAISESFYNTIKAIFPQSEITHVVELLQQFFNSFSHKENKDNIYVNIHDSTIDIAHLKNNDLNFFNTFKVDADTDIVYFILSIAEHLKLNQDKLHISLFGDVSSSSSLIGLMKKYIPHVELMKRPDTFSYPASFREFQDQQHYLQINSLLCAS